MSIPFMQYLRSSYWRHSWRQPYGRTRPISVDRPKDIEDMGHVILAQGATFGIEVLTTGELYMTCEIPDEEEEEGIRLLANALCENVPGLSGAAVDELVRRAYEVLELRDG